MLCDKDTRAELAGLGWSECGTSAAGTCNRLHGPVTCGGAPSLHHKLLFYLSVTSSNRCISHAIANEAEDASTAAEETDESRHVGRD